MGKRIPREVWVIGFFAAAAVLIHPTSQNCLVELGRTLQTNMTPLWQQTISLTTQMIEGILVVEHNAQLV